MVDGPNLARLNCFHLLNNYTKTFLKKTWVPNAQEFVNHHRNFILIDLVLEGLKIGVILTV